MSEVTTNKQIDLGQLTSEIGGVALSARAQGNSTTIAGDVLQSTLEAAVAAHIAPDLVAQAANEATIRQRADAALATNATYIARTSPTAAQNTAQIKALTQQMNGLIRLSLRRFDSAD